MRLVSIAAAVLAFVFAALILGGWIDIWWVLILTLALGSCEAITYPARVSAVNYLVPKSDLAPAIALGSTTFNGARIIGPAIAGLMILAWGTGPVIAVAAATYLLFAVVLMIIPVTEPQHHNTRIDVIADLIAGFAYVKQERGIAFLLVLVGSLGLFVRPSIELLPGYAAQVFARGPDGLAILLSAIGVGAMLAGFWVAQRGRTQGLTRLVAFSSMAMGAGWILSTFFDHIWIAAFFLAVSGFFMLCANVCSQTLIQNSVDPRMRARVIGIFIVISWGFPALGALALGWLASHFGIREAVIGASAIAAALYLWSRRVAPKVAGRLERGDEDRTVTVKRAAE
jgi:MFS family permease